jgi:hypothetical protein
MHWPWFVLVVVMCVVGMAWGFWRYHTRLFFITRSYCDVWRVRALYKGHKEEVKEFPHLLDAQRHVRLLRRTR